MSDYITVDVFTDKPFGGNPLVVFPDARSIPEDRLQSIAREFNYSETTFVYPPDDPDHTARVRIFTPTDEIPFAGHPNVGTAFVLGRRGDVFGWAVGETMVFEEKAGLVAIDLLRDAGDVTGARIVAPQPLDLGREIEAQVIAGCVGLAVQEVATDAHLPRIVSVGLPIVVAELASVAALEAAAPDSKAFAEAGDDFFLYLYARTSEGWDQLRTRMFVPLGQIVEDPATGSAAAALGAFLAHLDARPDVSARIAIAQGAEMGRPSAIDVDVTKQAGRVLRVGVAGRCTVIMQGRLLLS